MNPIEAVIARLDRIDTGLISVDALADARRAAQDAIRLIRSMETEAVELRAALAKHTA